MQIILVSSRSSRTHSFNVSRLQLTLCGAAVLMAACVVAAVLQYVFLSHAAANRDSVLRPLVDGLQAQHGEHGQSSLRDGMRALAARIGDLQARLLRLDALGSRLSQAAGLKAQEFVFERSPGRGGPETTVAPAPASMSQVERELERLASELDDRSDKLRFLESTLTQEQARRRLMPNKAPLRAVYSSSGFGWRTDPFNGHHAFHEGLDFSAQQGTPIHAAAGGVVVYAGAHPQYGNMVEIDHGNDLVTRYAHASKLLVKVGDVILQGGKIAEVGNTGRSTGAHLHFEVRHRGIAQDPARFLRAPG